LRNYLSEAEAEAEAEQVCTSTREQSPAYEL